jgi:hypothetical protein
MVPRSEIEERENTDEVELRENGWEFEGKRETM